jgi:predicted nuclease of predicted toxin-antitoxin system
MKLLANENFPLASVVYLRENGYDVAYIGEELKSIADITVREVALIEERTILTFDRDYGELIFRL